MDEKHFEAAIDDLLSGADMFVRRTRVIEKVSWKNLSKVQWLLVEQYLESRYKDFRIQNVTVLEHREIFGKISGL